jgi:hypothetical protein
MYAHSEKQEGLTVMLDFAHVMIEMMRLTRLFLMFWYNSPTPDFQSG